MRYPSMRKTGRNEIWNKSKKKWETNWLPNIKCAELHNLVKSTFQFAEITWNPDSELDFGAPMHSMVTENEESNAAIS